jgi:hypothetical protein
MSWRVELGFPEIPGTVLQGRNAGRFKLVARDSMEYRNRRDARVSERSESDSFAAFLALHCDVVDASDRRCEQWRRN